MSQNKKELSNHYADLGNNFLDKDRRHDEEISTHMKFLVSYFDCKPHHQVVEIGAGTCICSRELELMLKLEKPIICVDNSQSMLNHAKDHMSIKTVLSDGLEYSKLSVTYDRLFCRAFLHHLGKDGATEFIKNVFNQLTDGGVFVNIGMHGCNNRPWFRKLKEVYPRTHIDAEFFVDELKRAGFTEVRSYIKQHKVTVDKQSLFQSFRQRYVSIMQFLEESEIEKGIVEIDESYPNQDVIEFLDEYDFVVAKK